MRINQIDPFKAFRSFPGLGPRARGRRKRDRKRRQSDQRREMQVRQI
jgi:hypothetical protein